MEQEKILSMILSKLDNMEKGQQEIRKEQQDMKKEIKDMSGKLDRIQVRLCKLEDGQDSIKKFIFESERTFEKVEQNHRFIEKLKKVACE